MIELPEALTIAGQINDTIYGKRIVNVIAAHTPHKLAWYYGEPSKYPKLLIGRMVGKAHAYGGLVEIKVENANILLGEGVRLRFHGKNESCPPNAPVDKQYPNCNCCYGFEYRWHVDLLPYVDFCTPIHLGVLFRYLW